MKPDNIIPTNIIPDLRAMYPNMTKEYHEYKSENSDTHFVMLHFLVKKLLCHKTKQYKLKSRLESKVKYLS